MEDVYWDAIHYDLMHQKMDLDFDLYKDLCRRLGSPVLEIACGTGRLSIMLAKQGYDIYGIDISSDFLRIAEKKRMDNSLENIRFIKKDFRHFDLGKKFSFIFIPFNSFLHVYTRKDARDFFRSVRRHMSKDSRFLLNIFNPDLKMLIRCPNKRYPVSEYIIPETGEKVIVTENNLYDKATQINHITWYFKTGDNEEIKRALPMRIYYPVEIDSLLENNGFKIEEKWGNYKMEQFCSDSTLQILLCSLKN